MFSPSGARRSTEKRSPSLGREASCHTLGQSGQKEGVCIAPTSLVKFLDGPLPSSAAMATHGGRTSRMMLSLPLSMSHLKLKPIRGTFWR